MAFVDIKRKAFLFSAVLLAAALILGALPQNAVAENVTVKLVWKFPEPAWLEIEVIQGTYTLNYDQNRLKLEKGQRLQIGRSGFYRFLARENAVQIVHDSRITLTASAGGVFKIREPGKDAVSYRGDLTLEAKTQGWDLFNTLDSEDYLKGVVPIEMSNAWAAKGFAALKAQAVAARTYLLRNMDAQGVITDSPDIHQAYWGKTVEGEASRAVEATRGEILVDAFSGQPISIFYSSHNGGYTEETEHVWVSDDPHYRAKPDPFSQGIGGFIDNWSYSIAADALGKSFDLGPIRRIDLKKYASGRVYEVVLIDWLDREKKVSGGQFVSKFYPQGELNKNSFLSRLFEVKYLYPANPEPLKIPGAITVLSSGQNQGPKSGGSAYGTFVFNGSGWGHGVGMSQWGAYNMAQKGYTYQEILKYYYDNTRLVKRG